jgi:Cu-processing system permease protein
MNPIFILARMTFVQAIRRKIVLTGLLLGVCFLVIFSIGFHMILAMPVVPPNAAEATKFQHIIDAEKSSGLFLAGLYAVTFLGIAMAALLGADTLAGEINSGTIQVIVTKPIRRSDVVFGKWLGFAGLLGLYLLLLSGGTTLSILVQSGYVAPHLFAGLVLIYLESLLVMSLAMLFSSRFSALATGGVVFGLYGLAFIGGWIEQIGAVLKSPTAVKVGILTSLIIPSESLWRRAAFEMLSPLGSLFGFSPFGSSSVPSLLMVVYAVVYLLAVMALTVWVFQKRDL